MLMDENLKNILAFAEHNKVEIIKEDMLDSFINILQLKYHINDDNIYEFWRDNKEEILNDLLSNV